MFIIEYNNGADGTGKYMHYTLITPHEEFSQLIGLQRIQEGNVSYKGRNYKIISTYRLILYVVPTYSFEVNHILT